MMLKRMVIALMLMGAASLAQMNNDGKTAKHLLLVANQGDHTVSVIDADAEREIGKVAMHGNHAHEVVASPDGRFAYLPIYGDSGVGQPGTDGQTLEVADLEKREIIATIDLEGPSRPHCARFGPDGMLYVSAEVKNALDIIDPQSRK